MRALRRYKHFVAVSWMPSEDEHYVDEIHGPGADTWSGGYFNRITMEWP